MNLNTSGHGGTTTLRYEPMAMDVEEKQQIVFRTGTYFTERSDVPLLFDLPSLHLQVENHVPLSKQWQSQDFGREGSRIFFF